MRGLLSSADQPFEARLGCRLRLTHDVGALMFEGEVVRPLSASWWSKVLATSENGIYVRSDDEDGGAIHYLLRVYGYEGRLYVTLGSHPSLLAVVAVDESEPAGVVLKEHWA